MILSTPELRAPTASPSGTLAGAPFRIFFFGGARTVTGSMHVVETAGRRILLECGLFQGRRREAEERNRFLPFDARGIDSMVLSHAHIDHCGNIPSLVNHGYEGSIYTTHATRDLCAIMLRDSGRIHERDADYFNRKIRRRGEPELRPLYTEEDAVRAMHHFVGIDYGAPVSLGPGLTLELRDAGHVLGSALVLLDVQNGRRRRLCFTGDLGRRDMPLLRDPSPVEDVNVLIMESTYGDRLHEPVARMKASLAEVIHRTVARGGKLLIPSFALERAQTVVYLLHQLVREGAIPPVPIFVDSPLTVDITEVFKCNPEYFDAATRAFWETADPFGFGALRYISDVEESKALNYFAEPAIIIAGSGMCEAGRIVHHLRNNLEDERNTVLFVGFQARQTLGRRLVEHRPEVRIFGVDVPVDAEIVESGAFSSHGDQADLRAFVERCRATLEHTFLVHGEEPQALALAQRLQADGLADVTVPRAGAFHDV
ncbi:MAG: MBL fold metallo-hydrolase RNA specificity domain-containing protein [Gemmatimonadota bacterium]